MVIINSNMVHIIITQSLCLRSNILWETFQLFATSGIAPSAAVCNHGCLGNQNNHVPFFAHME